MPLLNDPTLQTTRTGHFGFSGTRIDALGASEYTLVTVALDTSPSVAAFKDDLEQMLNETIKACKYSPRADNLLIRLLYFNSGRQEIHGFKLLQNCQLKDYDDTIVCGGFTALYDATLDALEAVSNYGKTLAAPGNDFMVNAILFVITDGMDNCSTYGPKEIRKVMNRLTREETVESVQSILIGVNPKDCADFLGNFKKEVRFQQYVETQNATAETLAKLAAFVTQSISAQSRALGTGRPSVSLTF